ncbi:MAG: hypothetical protein ACXWP6_10370, partial [Ktedonobacterales bacterium]
AGAPSRRQQHEQCRQSIRAEKMEQVNVVNASSGWVLALAGVMHDPKAMCLGTTGGTSQPLDPAGFRALDDVAARIAFELL